MKPRTIFYCLALLLSFIVGYSAVHVLVEQTGDRVEMPAYRYAVQGRIVALNLADKTVSLRVPSPLTENDATRQISLSVPETAIIGRSSITETKEGTLLYNTPIPSVFSKLTIGDRAFVLFHLDQGRMIANALLYHSSFSPTP